MRPKSHMKKQAITKLEKGLGNPGGQHLNVGGTEWNTGAGPTPETKM